MKWKSCTTLTPLTQSSPLAVITAMASCPLLPHPLHHSLSPSHCLQACHLVPTAEPSPAIACLAKCFLTHGLLCGSDYHVACWRRRSPHHCALLICHYPRPHCSVLLALLHDLSPGKEVRAGTLPAIPHFCCISIAVTKCTDKASPSDSPSLQGKQSRNRKQLISSQPVTSIGQGRHACFCSARAPRFGAAHINSPPPDLAMPHGDALLR